MRTEKGRWELDVATGIVTALQTAWLLRERADALGSINFMLVSELATGKSYRAGAFLSQTEHAVEIIR